MGSTTLPNETRSEQRVLSISGAKIEVLATTEETQNGFGIIKLTVPSGFPGAPPHYHEHMPETFYVLEGTIELLLDGKTKSLSAGEFGLVQPGVVHGYRNPFDKPAAFLVTARGHDRFFTELIEWMQREPVWPPKDRDELVAFGRRHDTLYV